MNDFSRLIPYLNKKVLISLHRHPDGDAIGSAVAVNSIIKLKGGTPTIYSQDKIPEEFNFLEGVEQIVNSIDKNEHFEMSIVVDTGSPGQLGDQFPQKENRGVLFVVDHHKTRIPFGDYEIIDSSASAVGILIEQLANQANIEISENIAKAIWCSIFSDTGGFRYSSTNSETLKCGARMLEKGADSWEAAQALYESNPAKRIQLLGEALRTLTLKHSGKIAGMYISSDMVKRVECEIDLSSGFINYARSIKGVEIAFLVRPDGEDDKYIRVSFRSIGNYPVDQVAQKFGGGGHKNAAGCRFKATIDEGMDTLFRSFEEIFKN
jgi:bifunctional oligoribonuclease and PAP phosphatase NrnA